MYYSPAILLQFKAWGDSYLTFGMPIGNDHGDSNLSLGGDFLKYCKLMRINITCTKGVMY